MFDGVRITEVLTFRIGGQGQNGECGCFGAVACDGKEGVGAGRKGEGWSGNGGAIEEPLGGFSA